MFRRRPHESGSMRERMLRDVHRNSARSSRIGLSSGVMALGLFLLVFAYSGYQATRPHTAAAIIERGVASITDVDTYLDETLPDLRERASEEDAPGSFSLTAYPLPVSLTREELRDSSDVEIREIVLDRGAAIVYERGFDAFDNSGAGQSLGFLTVENVAEFGLDGMRGSNHEYLGVASVVLALVVALFAAITAASDFRPGVIRTIGGAFLGGAVAGLIVTFFLDFAFGRVGNGDDFSSDVAAIAQSLLDFPQRNFLVAAAAAAILFVAGIVITIAERRNAARLENDAPLVLEYEQDWPVDEESEVYG